VAKLRVVAFSLERTVRQQHQFENKEEVIMATGTIKRVVADRGFGFIADDGAKEYFFHRNSLDSSLDFDRLAGGERVEFEVEQSPKGPRANRVRPAAAA
jgi:cold shock protein